MGETTMIQFAWPFFFVLLPLPFIVYLLVPTSCCKLALKVPDLSDFIHLEKPVSFRFPKSNALLLVCVWTALVTGAARPQLIGKGVEIPQSGRDLLLAVDLSGSMQTKDFQIDNRRIDRLTALKKIVCDFIDKRKGDRIGLILFGSQAYVQTPLTFDIDTVKQLLLESQVGLAGIETAFGDAIGLSVKQLRDSPNESRVLILLTDGRNNAGELSPEKAAELASHIQLKIHTVAIGSKEMAVPTLFGVQKVNPSADIDEKTLQMVAEKTGGKYFRAYDTKNLAEIYQEINRLETTEREKRIFRPTE
jgi:Ca-activated chloride channel family protein